MGLVAHYEFDDNAGTTVVTAKVGENLTSSMPTQNMYVKDGPRTNSFNFNGILSYSSYHKAHYKLNDTSGTTIVDGSGSGKNATSTIDASYLTTTGKIDKCFEFHGNTSYNMISQFKMNETSGTTVVDSKNSYNATASANTSTMTTTGKINTALNMTGKTITFTNNSYPSTGSFSIAGWFYHTDYTYPRTTISLGVNNAYQAGNAGWQIGHQYSATGLNVCLNDGTNLVRDFITLDEGCQPIDWLNTWTHICVVFDRSAGLVKVYINGVLQTNTLNISSVTGSIGTQTFLLGNLIGWTLYANVDDLRFYNAAVRPQDIIGMYNDGLGTELSRTYVSMPANLTSQSYSVSIGFWGKMKKDNDNNCVTLGFDYGNNLGFALRGVYSGSVIYYIGNTSYNLGALITDEEWHHHFLTHSGSTTKYYIDGSLVDTRTTKSITASTAGENRIGHEYSHSLDGLIDDVRIYNKALIDGEVLAIYANGVGSEYVTAVTGTIQDYRTATYSFWVKPSTTPSNDRLMRLGSQYFFMRTNGKFAYSYYNGTSYPSEETTESITNGTWNHILMTIDVYNTTGQIIKVYFNGELVLTSIENSLKRVTTTTAQIGFSDSINFYRGQIADLRVYNEVLPLREIQYLYQLGISATKPMVVGPQGGKFAKLKQKRGY